MLGADASDARGEERERIGQPLEDAAGYGFGQIGRGIGDLAAQSDGRKHLANALIRLLVRTIVREFHIVEVVHDATGKVAQNGFSPIYHGYARRVGSEAEDIEAVVERGAQLARIDGLEDIAHFLHVGIRVILLFVMESQQAEQAELCLLCSLAAAGRPEQEGAGAQQKLVARCLAQQGFERGGIGKLCFSADGSVVAFALAIGVIARIDLE